MYLYTLAFFFVLNFQIILSKLCLRFVFLPPSVGLCRRLMENKQDFDVYAYLYGFTHPKNLNLSNLEMRFIFHQLLSIIIFYILFYLTKVFHLPHPQCILTAAQSELLLPLLSSSTLFTICFKFTLFNALS